MEPEPDDAAKEKAAQDNQKYVANKETGKWDLKDIEGSPPEEDEYEMEDDGKGNKIIKQASDAEKWAKDHNDESPNGWRKDPDAPGKLMRSESLKKTIGRVVDESNELQAIMALDDVGIKAEINKKGQVVIKKKDKKKAQRALEKSFKKGGWPTLKLEQRSAYEVVSEAREKIIEVVDAAAARELYLFMQNERDLQRQKDSIIKNIVRKIKSEKYDHKQAPKLWMYWVDQGAKAYDKLYSSPGAKTFDKDTRWSVAVELANEYKTEIDLGNYI